MQILRVHCQSEGVKPTMEFQEKVDRVLEMQSQASQANPSKIGQHTEARSHVDSSILGAFLCARQGKSWTCCAEVSRTLATLVP